MTEGKTLRLGLIGDNIAQSRAPLLHRLCGAQNGVTVQYDRLVPKERGQSFEQVFESCRTGGYRGINVTYPHKERVTAALQIDDPIVRAMGAVNTVVFEPHAALGYNTDYTGFIAAYRKLRGAAETGPVLMIGTGGVGRAVAFGLVALGTTDLLLVDRDLAKATALARALRAAAPDMRITIATDPVVAAIGAAGLINCTPVGMIGYEGIPLPKAAMAGAQWAFDAVYTPADTQFLTSAQAQGLLLISGWELFFFQGVQAWAFFSGLPVDQAALRHDLLQEDELI